MDFQQIIAGTVGQATTLTERCDGVVKASPMSYAGDFSTNDLEGTIDGYVGEGEFTDDPLTTFGGAGVVKIPTCNSSLRFICENGFEHHVAAKYVERGVGRAGSHRSPIWAGTSPSTSRRPGTVSGRSSAMSIRSRGRFWHP